MHGNIRIQFNLLKLINKAVKYDLSTLNVYILNKANVIRKNIIAEQQVKEVWQLGFKR